MPNDRPIFSEFFADVADYIYSAATGKLSDHEKAEIQERVNADIDKASGGDIILAAQQKAKAQVELYNVFSQADLEAEQHIGIFKKEQILDNEFMGAVYDKIKIFVIIVVLFALAFYGYKIYGYLKGR